MGTSPAPAPQTPPPERRRDTRWFVRPADEPANTGVPRFGYYVQHAMIATDGVVYGALKSLDAKKVTLHGRAGYLIRNASVTKIANATGPFTWNKQALPRRTAGHRLQAMHAKGIIVRYDTVSGGLHAPSSTSPFGTSWFVPLWGDVLATWAADPAIGTIGAKGFCVRGKAKTFQTSADLDRWQIDRAAAASPAAAASFVDLGDEAGTAAPAKPATLGEDLATVHRAILDFGVQADETHAASVIELARATDPAIPADAIAELCGRMAQDWGAKVRTMPESKRAAQRLTVGWFQTGIAAAVALRKRERERATAATRAG